MTFVFRTGKRGRKRKIPLPDASIDESSIVLRNAATSANESIDIGQQLTANGSTLMPPPATPSGHSIVQPDAITPAHSEPGAHPPSIDSDIPIPFTPGDHVGMTPSLNLSGMTPVGLHGDYPLAEMMTPHHHGIDQLESIPNLPADQVSSILNGTGMDAFANMGFDEGQNNSGGMSERMGNDWNDDYDFPPSVGAHVSF